MIVGGMEFVGREPGHFCTVGGGSQEGGRGVGVVRAILIDHCINFLPKLIVKS